MALRRYNIYVRPFWIYDNKIFEIMPSIKLRYHRILSKKIVINQMTAQNCVLWHQFLSKGWATTYSILSNRQHCIFNIRKSIVLLQLRFIFNRCCKLKLIIKFHRDKIKYIRFRFLYYCRRLGYDFQWRSVACKVISLFCVFILFRQNL